MTDWQRIETAPRDGTWGAGMIAYPPDTPESRARHAMKFVKVVGINGHLTDISIAMILVELKRCGVELQIADRRSPPLGRAG